MYQVVLVILIMVATFALVSCGKSETDAASGEADKSPALTAASLGEQSVLSPKEYLAQDSYASADTARGEALSMQCRACHTLEQGGPPIVGPNLFGFFGTMAGSNAEYIYSDVLAASGFVWTPRALDGWLAEPYLFLPGNRMTFPGLINESDRNAVIAYLLQQTIK